MVRRKCDALDLTASEGPAGGRPEVVIVRAVGYRMVRRGGVPSCLPTRRLAVFILMMPVRVNASQAPSGK